MTNRDLFLAVLAMDSYNQGYGKGEIVDNDMIGTATRISSTPSNSDDFDIGFSATSYSWNGETIIAYRGTDSFWGSSNSGGSDSANGYGVAVGGALAPQAVAAVNFYKSSLDILNNGAPAFEKVDAYSADVTFVGHSLGGGLAGLMADVYGKKADIFNAMGYRSAADNAVAGTLPGMFGISVPEVTQDYYTQFGIASRPDDPENVNQWVTTGQILSGLINNSAVEGHGIELDPNTSGLDATKLHSMSLEVILLYAKLEVTDTSWTSIADSIFTYLYDDSFAAEIGIEHTNGEISSVSQKLRDMIAYSVIDEGNMPFGNSAASVMFNDANDLAKAGQIYPLSWDTSVYGIDTGFLARAAIQFAGDIAKGGHEYSSGSPIHDGIAAGGNGATAVSVDVGSSNWVTALDSGGATIAGLSDFKAYLKYTVDADATSAGDAMKQQINGYLDSAKVYIVGEGDGKTYNAGSAFNNLHDGSQVTEIASVHPIIIGLRGDDDIQGTNQDDVIDGGFGDDKLYGGKGDDILIGGDGKDTADYSRVSHSLTMAIGDTDAGTLTGSVTMKDDGDGGTDSLVGIEVIRLTEKADTLKIQSLDAGNSDVITQGLSIDMGTHGELPAVGTWAGLVDTVDVSALNDGVSANFSDRNNITISNAPNSLSGWAYNLYAGSHALKVANAEGFIGTNYNDTVEGGDNLLYANLKAGDDTVDGTGQGAELYLGQGDDTVLSYGRGALIQTGEGSDAIFYSGLGYVKDLADEDRIWRAADTPMWGGWRGANSDDPWYYDIWGDAYLLNQAGELIISRANLDEATRLQNGLYIANYKVGEGGMHFYEREFFYDSFSDWKDPPPQFQRSGIGAFICAFNQINFASMQGVDPLVLDLTGFGLNLEPQLPHSTLYDFDQDGFLEHGGWTGDGAGFLVRDLNGNGVVDGIQEMFGNAQVSGFDALAAFDKNELDPAGADPDGNGIDGDGKIDAHDAIWSSLKVWVDANSDGVTDAGELKTLDELGIVSINLNVRAPTESEANNEGNAITAVSTFTYADGSTHDISNVVFEVNNYDSIYSGGTSVQQPLDGVLPELKGSGILKDLRLAMSQDSGLQSLVEQVLPTLTSPSLMDLREKVIPVLEAWAGPQQTHHNDIYVLVSYDQNQELRFVDQLYQDAATGTWGWAGSASYNFDVMNPDANVNGVGYDPINHKLDISTFPDGLPTWLVNLAAGTATGIESSAGELMKISGDVLDMASALFGSVIAVDQARDQPLLLQATNELTAIYKAIDLDSARLAFQGPLHPFFQGIAFDPVKDNFVTTTPQGLEPLFKNIFDAAVTSTEGEIAYINNWKSLIFTIRNDLYRADGSANFNIGYVFASIVEAYENSSLTLDIASVAGALGISPQTVVYDGNSADPAILTRDEWTNGNTSYIYLGDNNVTARGGPGSDVYVAGGHFGHVVIDDYEQYGSDQEPDYLRFSHHNASDFVATRDGVDLVLDLKNGLGQIRVLGQFSGGITNLDGSEYKNEQGIYDITFADGEVWNLTDIAKAVSRHTDGADTILGTENVDYLDGGLGNDILEGGRGSDTYYFATGYGHDIIQEDPSDAGILGADTLMFGPGITFKDLILRRSEGTDDLVISVNGSDQLTITNQFNATHSALGVFWQHRIETFVFADGSAVDWSKILTETLKQATTAGNDRIFGYYTDDKIAGGTGDDYESGSNGDDTYIYNLGDGHDTIQDQGTDVSAPNFDTVVFGQGISESDIHFQRTGNSADLEVYLNNQDILTIAGQFSASDGFIWGIYRPNQIEQFLFADGTTISASDVMSMLLSSEKTSGDDVIYGFYNQDRLDGGAGNDTLYGGNFADTYVFGHGYGHDTVIDIPTDFNDTNNDSVEFAADVLPSDVSIAFSADSNDLVLTLNDSGETLTIKGQYEYHQFWIDYQQVDYFKFADGTVWTAEQVRLELIAAEETSGNDFIHGTQYGDTLEGGAGDDVLTGGHSDDTYVFSIGDGHDTIQDAGPDLGSNDTIFLRDRLPTDLKVAVVAGTNDILLSFVNSSDTILVKNGASFGISDYIESVRFADGSTWAWTAVEQLAINQSQTSGDDTIIGTDAPETIVGGLGNDFLEGKAGDDTYLFSTGDGNDTIWDNGPQLGSHDQIYLVDRNVTDLRIKHVPNSDDMLFTFANSVDSILIKGGAGDSIETNIESVKFSDGTTLTWAQIEQIAIDQAETSGDDTIYGTDGSETFTGGPGNDLLIGGNGFDTYVFNPGDGKDTIADDGPFLSYGDKVVIHGYSVQDLKVYSTGNPDDIKLAFANSTDSITLSHNVSGFISWLIESVVFDDGTSLNNSQLLQMMVPDPTNAAPTIAHALQDVSMPEDAPFSFVIPSDTFNDADGDQLSLTASLADGSSLPSWLSFDVASRTFSGTPPQNWNGSLAVKVTASESLHSTSDTFTLTVTPVNDAPTAEGVSGFIMASNTVLGIEPALLLAQAHDIDGDTLSVAGVSNAVHGSVSLLPDGTISFAPDFGYTGTASFSFTVSDGAGGEATATATLNVTDGSGQTITGTSGNDTIVSLAGNDTLAGGDGNDTYVYANGSGSDIITELRWEGSSDTLSFTGHSAAGLHVTRSGADLIVSFANSPDQVTLAGMATDGDYYQGVENFTFADGTTLNAGAIYQKVIDGSGTSGDDSITGFNVHNDVITGGLGNDVLNGLEGDDTYIYNNGDGSDIITENRWSGYSDRLTFTGHNLADLQVTRSGSDLVLSFAGSSDQVTLAGMATDGDYYQGVENFTFADGTTLNAGAIYQKVIDSSGTSGDDVITGFSIHNDVITGGLGNDVLNGLDGNDTYIYNNGDGADIITESAWSGYGDQLSFTGHNFSDLHVGRSGSDLVLSFTSSVDQVTLTNEAVSNDYGQGLENFSFADGTTKTIADIYQKAVDQQETSGNDTITGFNTHNDVIVGGQGNDLLKGGDGNDTYIYNNGDGVDTITENAYNGNDTLTFTGHNLSELSVYISTSNPADLILAFSGTADQITLTGNATAYTSGAGIENFIFADGSTKSITDVLALVSDNSSPPAPTIALTSDTGGSASDGITKNATLKGTANASSNVILQDGSFTATVATDASGYWTFTPEGLSDGNHHFVVSQTDDDGRSGTASIDFTLDTVTPQPTIGLQNDSGISGIDGITNSSGLSGTAESYSVVTISEGSFATSLTSDSLGNWIYTPAGLSDGTYNFQVSQIDAAGNIGTASVSMVLETTAPTPLLALESDSGTSSLDSLTNVGTVNVSELVAGASWQYSTDNGTTWTTGSGTSFTLTGDGAKTAIVRQTDPAGNISSNDSLSFVLDTTPPQYITYGDIESPTYGHTNRFLQGTAEANSIFVLSIQQNIQGPAQQVPITADASGNWTFDLAGFADGDYWLSASSFDAAGNFSGGSGSWYNLDTVAPNLTVGLLADTGTNSTDRITNVKEISGTAERFTVVTIKEGANVLGTINMGASDVWTFTPDSLAQGDHTFDVSDADKAGNVTETTFDMSYDTVVAVPTLSLVNDSGFSSTDAITNSVALNGTTEANATITVKDGTNILGTTFADGTGAWIYAPAGLAEGFHNFTVSATDVAGNLSASSAGLGATLDRTAPNAPVLALAADTGSSSTDNITSNGTVNVSGLEVGSAWQYSTDAGVNWATGSGSSLTLTGAGSKAVIVRQVDSAGNVSAISNSLAFTLVNAPTPTIALVTDSGSSAIDGITSNAALKGTSGANAVVTISDNGTTLGTATANASGAWIYTPAALANGSHNFTVSETDTAGDTGTGSLAVTLDTIVSAPTLALAADTGSSSTDKKTSNGTVNVIGLEVGASWQYSINGGSSWIAGTGSSVTLTGDGSKTIITRQTDTAGNFSANSTSLAFTLDTTAPIMPTLSLAGDTGSSATDAITSNGRVNVSGLESFSTWQYSVDGGTSWATGSINFFTLFSGGVYSAAARQVDAAGNVSAISAILPFTFDKTAPTVTIDLADNTGSASVETSDPALLGTAEPNGIVTILEDTTVIATVTANASGAWAYTPTGLADGPHHFHASQTDIAGNVGNSNANSGYLILDTVALAPILGLQVDTGSSTTDKITNDASLTGTAEGGSVITIRDGTTILGTAGADGAGYWSYVVRGLADGTHNLSASLVDAAGNASAPSANFVVTLDTVAPSAAPIVTLAADNGSSSSDKITNSGVVNVSGLDAGAIWQYSTNSGSTWIAGSGSSFTLSGDGAKTVFVRQVDVAGNASTNQARLDFTLDQSVGAPSVALVSDTGSSSIDKITSSATLSGSAEAYSVVTIKDGATVIGTTTANNIWGNWTFTPSGLADGAHSFTVSQTDVAGNVSAYSTSLVMTLDTLAPNAAPTMALVADTGTSTTDKITSNGTINITGLESGAIWQYSLNAGSSWTTGSGISFNLTGDATKSVIVRQTDLAGNISANSGILSFTLDTTVNAPSISLVNDTGYTADNITSNPALGGIAEANATVTIKEGTTVLGSTGADGSGAWTYTPANLSNGPHSFLVNQTDKAGNVSAYSAAFAMTFDTVAAPPTLLLASDTGSSSTDKITSNGTVNITGLESGAIWQYCTDVGGTWTWGDATSVTLTGDGGKTLFVRQFDVAGNISNIASLAFTLDKTIVIPSLALAADTGVSSTDGVTSNGTLTISGLEAGAIWQYSTNAGSTWTTGSGTSLTFTGDGTRTVVVRQTDTAGNVSASSASLGFKLDTVASAPTILLVSDTGTSSTDKITNNVAVRGVAEANATVTIRDGTAVLGTVAADSGGGWSFTPTGFSDGTHNFTASQTDVAGNVSAYSANYAVTLNTTAPLAPTAALAVDSGSSATDKITSNGAINVTGLEAGATWQYSTNGGSTWVAGSGTSFTLSGTGTKTFIVRQTDIAGNVSDNSAPFTFLLDNNVNALTPTLAYDSGSGGSDKITNNGTVIAGGLEAGATFVYSIDGGSSWISGTGTSVSLTGDGAKSIQMRQTDLAGNVSAVSTSLSFTIDTVVSVLTAGLTIDSGSSSTDHITNVNTLSGTREVGATVTVTEGSTTIGTSAAGGGTWTISPSGLSQGAHTFTITETDIAGNTASTSLAMTYDTAAPSRGITTPASNVPINNVQTISGTGEAGTTIQLYDGAGAIGGPVTVDATGHWTQTVTFGTSSTSHSVTATDTDVAGNASTSTAVIFTTYNIIQGGTTATISGTGSNDRIYVTSSNTTVNGNAGDDWFTFNTGASGDTHTITGALGTDMLDFSQITTAVAANLTAGTASGSQVGSITVNTVESVVGGSANDTITGASVTGTLDGGGGNDTITAGAAGDIIVGGSGNDILNGGVGADTFAYHSGFGLDTINSFTASGTSHDTLQFDSAIFADLVHLMQAATQQGADVLITQDASDTITLKNIALANITSSNTQFV